ncbi:MAG: hypothetical protein ACAI43_15950 [Phycisphaerae bacterium]
MRVGPPNVTQTPPPDTSPVDVAKDAGAGAAPTPAGAEAFAGETSGEVLRGAGDALGDALRWGSEPKEELPKFPAGDVLLADTGGAKLPGTVAKGPSPATDAAAIAKLGPKQQLEHVQQLRQKNPAAFEALVKAVRDGTVTDKKVAMAVSIELTASTPWGKSGQGKEVVAQVRTMYAQGKLAFGAVPGGHLGYTKPDKAPEPGKGSGSVMTVSDKLAGTPEGLASVLAHEGLHALLYAKGKTPVSPLESEVAGNLAGAEVWASFGPDKEKVGGAAAGEALKTLKDDAAVFDPKASKAQNQAKMEVHVATEYAYSHAKAGTKGRYSEAAGMIEHVLQRADAADVLRGASNSQIKRMFFAYEKFKQHLPADQLSGDAKRNLETLSEELDRRGL